MQSVQFTPNYNLTMSQLSGASSMRAMTCAQNAQSQMKFGAEPITTAATLGFLAKLGSTAASAIVFGMCMPFGRDFYNYLLKPQASTLIVKTTHAETQSTEPSTAESHKT